MTSQSLNHQQTRTHARARTRWLGGRPRKVSHKRWPCLWLHYIEDLPIITRDLTGQAMQMHEPGFGGGGESGPVKLTFKWPLSLVPASALGLCRLALANPAALFTDIGLSPSLAVPFPPLPPSSLPRRCPRQQSSTVVLVLDEAQARRPPSSSPSPVSHLHLLFPRRSFQEKLRQSVGRSVSRQTP